MESARGGAHVRLTGVTKWYREGDVRHDVLRQLDFEVLPGEFVVLLGRSGSGKSTLLNLIGGIDLPSRPAGEQFTIDLRIVADIDRQLVVSKEVRNSSGDFIFLCELRQLAG